MELIAEQMRSRLWRPSAAAAKTASRPVGACVVSGIVVRQTGMTVQEFAIHLQIALATHLTLLTVLTMVEYLRRRDRTRTARPGSSPSA